MFLRVATTSAVLFGATVLATPASVSAVGGTCALAPLFEVDSQADLELLKTDSVDCQDAEIVQVADIELDSGGNGLDDDANEWEAPISDWHGTFDGQGFEIVDVDPFDAEASLFDSPSGSLTIIDAHMNVDVRQDSAGAFVGASSWPVTILGSSTEGDITSTGAYAGGFIGWMNSGVQLTIQGSSASGQIEALEPGPGNPSFAGGFVALTFGDVAIDNSSSIANVRSENFSGGLVGVAYAGIQITESWTLGSVRTEASFNAYAGGLIGYLDVEAGSVTDSFSRAWVDGETASGGLVGYNTTDLEITRSYYSSWGIRSGGLVGVESGTGSTVVTSSFCSDDFSGCGDGPNDTGAVVSDDQLKSRAFLEPSPSSWDFGTTWCFRPGLNGGYPTNHCPLVLELDLGLDAGTSVIQVPFAGPSGSLNVDWDAGDSIVGSPDCRRVYFDFSPLQLAEVRCDYGLRTGPIRIEITGSAQQYGSLLAPLVGSELITDVVEWGTMGTTSFSYALIDASNLTSVPDSIPTTVTSLTSMFQGAVNFNDDISGWDITNVTDMTDMFDGVELSTRNYTAILNGWSAQGVQPNVVFDAGTSTYSCQAKAARDVLTIDNGWTITDGGHRRCGTSGGDEENFPSSRTGGADRFETAALISASVFSPGVETVYLATGAGFADALAVGSAGAPVLLTEFDRLPQSTVSELVRLRPGRIVIVGGVGVISTSVEELARQYTSGSVVRVGGADRFETAALISASVFAPGVETVYLATGAGFADALAVGPAGAPVLLVRQDCIPPSTIAELTRLNASRVVLVGGTGVLSDGARRLTPCSA